MPLSIVSTEPESSSANQLSVVSSKPVQKVTPADIEKVAKEYGVPADLAVGVAHIESAYDPFAKSNKGAQGIMQLMPDTAKRYGVTDSYDPEQNIRGGVQYLRDLLKQFNGDRDKALAAYNWGEKHVADGKEVPSSVQKYVKDVSGKAKEHAWANLKVVSTEPDTKQQKFLSIVSTEPEHAQSLPGQEKPKLNQGQAQSEIDKATRFTGDPFAAKPTSTGAVDFTHGMAPTAQPHSTAEKLETQLEEQRGGGHLVHGQRPVAVAVTTPQFKPVPLEPQRLSTPLGDEPEELKRGSQLPNPTEEMLAKATPEERRKLAAHPWVRKNLDDPRYRQAAQEVSELEHSATANPFATAQDKLTDLLGTRSWMRESDPWAPSILGTGKEEEPQIRKGVKEIVHGEGKRGVTDVISGGFNAAQPIMIYAGLRSPIPVARGLIGAEIGSTVAGELTEKLGGTPEDVALAHTLGAFGLGMVEGGFGFAKETKLGLVDAITKDLMKSDEHLSEEDAHEQATERVHKWSATGDPKYINYEGVKKSGLGWLINRGTQQATKFLKGATSARAQGEEAKDQQGATAPVVVRAENRGEAPPTIATPAQPVAPEQPRAPIASQAELQRGEADAKRYGLTNTINGMLDKGLTLADTAQRIAQQRPEIPKDDIRRMVLTAGSRKTGKYRIIGSPQEPVHAETPETIGKQIDALKAGTVSTVMIPQGGEVPAVPEGMQAVTVDKGKGAGTYIFDPKKISAETIRQAAESGKHGELLGHVQSKAELADKPKVVVQARAEDGTPVQESVVEDKPEVVAVQTKVLEDRHPDAEVTVTTPQEVLGERAGVPVEQREAADEGKEPVEAEKPQEGAPVSTEPASIIKVPIGSLVLDPNRFQYKLNVDEKGVSSILKGRKWNPDLAGVVSVWQDPHDEELYVVNGHHRVDLARENGVQNLDVRVISAPDAKAARRIGALQNIAEGRGSAIDAAQFFRATGTTEADLKEEGVTLTEAKAADGIALSKLAQPIFDDVATGKMRTGRGVAIGNATADHAQQEAILKLIRKREASGKSISDSVVTELGRMVEGAKEHTEHQETLFGVQSMTRNLALEKAEVSDYIRKQIGSEKKLFSGVSTEATAQRLGKAGNVIDAGENAKIAQQAAQAQELYDRLSTRSGDINDILNRAADELANGESPNAVKQRAYDETRIALGKALQGTEAAHDQGVQAHPRTGEAEAHAEPAAGEREGAVVHAETAEPTLPGMENVPAERAEATAGAEGERLTGEVAQPAGDISRATGEMERKSPLFRDSEASGQTPMFSGIAPPEEFVKQLRTVFPSVAKRFDDWVSGEPTIGGEQKATMRQTRGEMDRALSVVAEKLKSYKKEWVSRPREDFRKFAQAVEGLIPVDQLAPRDQELANIFKSGFDEIRSQIRALKPEVLQSYIEHYFPHIWERPGVAEKAVRNVLASKRPFAGSERFRQKRTVPTIEDGLDLGLKPVSWNPVDMFLLKYKEEAQFLMAHKTLDMMKDNGNAKFVRINQASPEGWVKLDDRIGTVYGKEQVQTVEPGQDELYDEGGKPRSFTVIRGHYWAPPEAAKVFNNFVSRGFAGRYTTYDIAQGLNSNLNALQLGISAFHVTTTSVNAATSDIALGLQQLREGKIVEGATRIGSGVATLPSVANTLRNGSKLMKEYLTPGSYEKFSREANAVEQAGGRAKQQTIQLHALDNFMNAIKNRAYGDAAKAAPSAIIEASVWPVMEYYVPRMKFGVFYNMAHDILERADRENWPEERTRARTQKAWDSVDNRFGQMVYDNLFWKKSVRDSLQLATRSVGWNFGTIRELGGAVPDLIKETARVSKGEAPEISDRVAFAFALAGYTAMVGATMTYLMTGKRPQTWKDYYYPRQADGTRMSIPGYMKDVVAYMHDPKQTVINKMGPLIELTAEAIQNRDFYGTEIRHKDDPAIRQLWQFAKFVGNTAMPFSISGSKKLVQKAGGDTSSFKETVKSGLRHPGQIMAGQFGFQPAPAFIQHSPALNKAYEYEFENRPPGIRTQAQADHHQYMRQMEDMYRSGKVDQKTIDSLLANNQITHADVRKAKVVSRLDPLAWAAFSLTLEQALNVYKDADEREKKILKPIIIKKRSQISKEPDPDKRAELMRSYLQTVHPQGK